MKTDTPILSVFLFFFIEDKYYIKVSLYIAQESVCQAVVSWKTFVFY